MPIWLVKNTKAILLCVLFSILSLYTGFFIGLWDASNRAEIKVENKYLTAAIEGKNKYEKKKQEIRSLNDTELIRRYCASSVHDIPYDKCVRTVRYVE